MNHEHWRDALSALHDNELNDESRKEVLTHLESCSECRATDQRWKQIAGVLFRAPLAPGAAETDRFVHRVMAQIEEDARSVTSVTSGWWEWLEDRLMVPVLSMGLAALLISIVIVKQESVAPADALLLVDGQNHAVGQWVLPPDPASADKMLTSASEVQ